ncbi:MAG TPA: TolC family protein, partial [Tepidisphaeraceae bacterium]|nr:TolC family protein [Tepidisphaeraceae bacterium]
GPGEKLSLVAALSLTSQNNEEIALRGEDYVQALIAKNRAVANFLPTVSFQPNFTLEQRASDNGGSGIGTGGGTGTTSTVTVGSGGFRNVGQVSYRTEAPVVGSINLFRGGADAANLKAAEAQIRQRRELLMDVQSAVLLNTAQVFYQVLRSERQVEVLRSGLKLQEARVKDEEGRLANGLSTKLAVAQSKAQAADTRARLALAEGDVGNARNTLVFLTGLTRTDYPLADDFVVPDQRPDDAELERAALDGRQDLRAAAAAIEVARESVDVAVAQYYPSVSLNVTGFLYREYFSDASKWNTVLTTHIPIFSAGIIEADVRNAWSRLRQAALAESNLRRSVVNDVRQAILNLRTAERRVKELEDQVAAADEALKQAQAALANSLAIVLDVLTAQDQLLSAQLLLTGAKFDRTVFYLDLLRATGRLIGTVRGTP